MEGLIHTLIYLLQRVRQVQSAYDPCQAVSECPWLSYQIRTGDYQAVNITLAPMAGQLAFITFWLGKPDINFNFPVLVNYNGCDTREASFLMISADQ